MATIDDLDAKLDALDGKIDALEAKVEGARTVRIVCPTCGGAGQLLTITDVNNAQQESYVTCPKCDGDTEIAWGRIVEL